jgi:hypothetical protein
MGTLSATGSMGGSSGGGSRIGTQTRRLTMNSRGAGPSSSNSSGSGRSEMLVASGLSPVLAPLHFDDDQQHQGNGTSAEVVDETSDEVGIELINYFKYYEFNHRDLIHRN